MREMFDGNSLSPSPRLWKTFRRKIAQIFFAKNLTKRNIYWIRTMYSHAFSHYFTLIVVISPRDSHSFIWQILKECLQCDNMWGDTEVNKADIVPAWETNRKMNRHLFIILCNTCRCRQGSHAQGTWEEKFPSAERSEKTIKNTIFVSHISRFKLCDMVSFAWWVPTISCNLSARECIMQSLKNWSNVARRYLGKLSGHSFHISGSGACIF